MIDLISTLIWLVDWLINLVSRLIESILRLIKSDCRFIHSFIHFDFFDSRCTSPTDQQYDQKNIRRRVYDALNVLMAMNIISKEKKEIRWLGLPTNSVQEANGLEQDKAKRMDRIKAKTQQLQDLLLQVNLEGSLSIFKFKRSWIFNLK